MLVSPPSSNHSIILYELMPLSLITIDGEKLTLFIVLNSLLVTPVTTSSEMRSILVFLIQRKI